MKIINFLLLSSFAMLSFSCSTSITMVAENTYKATCSKIGGSCEEDMKKTCPKGYKVTNQDWSYGFGGAKDNIFFTCEK